MIENPVRLVRELKGAPLSVYFALICVQQRVSQGWLEAMTGYTDKPVARALQQLREIGLVDQTSAGWGLCAGQQIPLPIADVPELDASTAPADETLAGSAQREGGNSDTNGGSRNNSDSIIINTTELINEEINSTNNNNGGSRNNSDLEPKPWPVAANRRVLGACGVVGGKAEELASKNYTPVEIRAMEISLRRTAMRYTPGLLVHVLQGGDRPPLEDVAFLTRRYWYPLMDGEPCPICGACEACDCILEDEHGD